MLKARVRDDRIEPAEALERRVDDVLVPVPGCQVGVLDVDTVDSPAVRFEPRDDRGADPAAGARHEGDPHT